jgi:hypothetical protein
MNLFFNNTNQNNFMSDQNRTFQIFSDESGYEGGNQFGCLAKIVGEKHNQKELNQELKKVLEKYGIEELKFKNVNNNRKVAASKEYIDLSLKYINQGLVGIHVIIWDKKDSRHSVYGRCDIANLCRMYYHNLRSINKQWIVDAQWEFYPDEFSAINWHTDVVKYLNDRPLKAICKLEPDLFGFYTDLKINYSKVKELSSKNFPILQLADIYAGLCRTSRQEHINYKKWHLKQSSQQSLFQTLNTFDVSKSLQYKFLVKEHFKLKCDNFKLGVNISQNGYLQTFRASRKLSIWHYTPQGEFDKAPIAK